MGVLWYDGKASITDFSNRHTRDTSNLNKGGKHGFGWGANSSKVFQSRAQYLVEIMPGKKIVFVLTYRTGTYPDTKKHINAFLMWLKRHKMNGFTYVVELQKNNTIHYHFLISAWSNFKPKEINDAWCRIRGDYSPNAVTGLETLRRNNKKGLLAYMGKGSMLNYMMKCAKLNFKESENMTPEAKEKVRSAYETKMNFLKNNVDRLWSTSRNLVGVEKIRFNDEEFKNLIISKAKSVHISRPKENVEIFVYELGRRETQIIFSQIMLIEKTKKKEAEEKKRKQQEKIKKKQQERLQTALVV